MTELEKAKQYLEKGGVIIYPTETVFAVGCLINKPETIKRLYKIKRREESQPTLAVFPDLELIKEYVKTGEQTAKLAKAFWPGPLTLCLPAIKSLPETILGPGNTLGVRIPDHEWLLKLLNSLKVPLLAPSANFKGQPPPRKLAEIDRKLIDLVDYVVEIEPGGNLPSTIITIDEDKGVYNITRTGEISEAEIKQVLL